jgi:hypothetical protein
LHWMNLNKKMENVNQFVYTIKSSE